MVNQTRVGIFFVVGGVSIFLLSFSRLLISSVPTEIMSARDISVFVYSTYPQFIGAVVAFLLIIAGLRIIRATGLMGESCLTEQQKSILIDVVKNNTLPAATIFLTIFFSIISFLPPHNSKDGVFPELAKLTLGAFIGSLVQKRVDNKKSNSEQ